MHRSRLYAANIRATVATVATCLCVPFVPLHGVAAQAPEPRNVVVVALDASGSYRTRFDEALSRVVTTLDAMGSRRLHRWDLVSDSVVVITVDAMPGVIFAGDLRGLHALRGDSSWKTRMRSRADYAACTDVTAAFSLAAEHLHGDPRYVHKYLWIFSDLVDEPPTTSIRRCAPAGSPSAPPAALPWNALRDVSTAVYWMPAEQVLAWRRGVAAHGLATHFLLYSESESASAPAPTPPVAEAVLSSADSAALRHQASTTLGKLLGGAVLVILCIGALPVALVIVLRRRARRCVRRQAQRTSHPTVVRRTPLH